MRYLLKNLFLGMLILVVLFLTHITPAWAPDGTRPHPGREAPAGKPTQPTGVSPEERTKEAMGVRGTLTINLISPREIYTNTPQISVSYNLSLSSPLNVRTIPVKVALFLDNQLKNTTEINNFPNGETRRLFISTPAPNQAREYVVTLKAVKADVSDVSLARSEEIYATATQRIKVNEALPDLVIENFEVFEPELKTKGTSTYAYIPFKVKVKNIGVSEAGIFSVGITETTSGRDLLIVGGSTSAPLPPGRTVELSRYAEVTLAETTAQSYFLRAKADVPTREFVGPEGHIRELNEENNLSSIIEVRMPFVRIEALSYQGYRGGQIEIKGSFGSSLGNKKVAIYREGVRKAYADVINFSSSKIIIKIPNVNSIERGLMHKLRIVDNTSGQDVPISNDVDLYICNPLRITYIGILESNYPGALINERFGLIRLEKDGRCCKKISWALARNYPTLDTEVKTEETPHDSFWIRPNLSFGPEEYRTNVTVIIRDPSLVAFDDDSEGTAKIQVPIYNLFRKEINEATVFLILPCIKIHIDQAYSYLQIPEFCPERGGMFYTLNIPSSFKVPLENACDLKVWFRDINANPRLENVLTMSRGIFHLRLPFETGGPDEIGLDYWSCAGEVPDINLLRLEIRADISFLSGWPVTPDSFFKVSNIIVDLDADLNNLSDAFVEAFVGDIDRMIKDRLRQEIGRALGSRDVKQTVFDLFMKHLRDILGNSNARLLSIEPKGNSAEILYYVAP
jgi:hypothetical protein